MKEFHRLLDRRNSQIEAQNKAMKNSQSGSSGMVKAGDFFTQAKIAGQVKQLEVGPEA